MRISEDVQKIFGDMVLATIAYKVVGGWGIAMVVGTYILGGIAEAIFRRITRR